MMDDDRRCNLIDEAEGRYLLGLARWVIGRRLGVDKAEPTLPPQSDPNLLEQPRGVFVTLKQQGKLRGCIGSLSAHQPLAAGVRQNALNAAFSDPRFTPLTAAELASLRIEISVLTPLRPLEYDQAADLPTLLRPGRDGVLIEEDDCSATFLPQVWEQLPDPVRFLEHLCLKAGLPADSWCRGGLKVKTYQVQPFAEEE